MATVISSWRITNSKRRTISRSQKLAILEEVDPGWRQRFARVLKLYRTQYYRKPAMQQAKDAKDVTVLRAAHAEHPFYGVARLAIHLGRSETKARRIRNLAGVVIPTANKKHRHRSWYLRLRRHQTSWDNTPASRMKPVHRSV